MQGLMMDFPLTLTSFLRRAETLFQHKSIITRLPDKSIHRYKYKDFISRTKKLAVALSKLGVVGSDRVATLCWNHYQHLEIYFAVPCSGFVLHALNLRLSPDDLTYIVNHAEDKVIIVDQVLLPLFDKFRGNINVKHVVVIPNGQGPIPDEFINYESLLASADEMLFEGFEGDENTASSLCYTSGTTGRPKGVLYSHRSIVLHSLTICFSIGEAFTERDVVLPVVPMFHVNAWGMPFHDIMLGTTIVLPGPYLDPVSLLELLESEKVTITAGVPTIWNGILQVLDTNPGKYNLNALRLLLVGGSNASKSLIQGFEQRHQLKVTQAWGMTETSPLGSVCYIGSREAQLPFEEQFAYRSKQGKPASLVEIRGRNDNGIIPWDGKTMGELEVRGPWVAGAYYKSVDDEGKFTPDGWFCTGDIVTIDSDGCIEIKDRSKDVIKSGGEWISSIALEGAIMGHPAVLEAAVFGVADAKWGERPMAAVVLKPGMNTSAGELQAFLTPLFVKFWLPDAFEFVKEIPKTSVGKFKKSVLREFYKDMRSQSV
ncbi:MAG TPA: long-chain fatty acid--CoA ligase [Chryseolinea sp.]